MPIDLGYDESGSADVLLVSMQLSITEQARKLDRKWRRILRDARVPYFHSKEFGNYSYGVFAGLSRPDRLSLLAALARLSKDHISIGMTAKLTKSLYDEKTTALFRSKWGTAYTFSIQMLLASAYLFADAFHLKPEFNILIEDGHRHSAQAVESLSALKKTGMAFPTPSHVLSVALGSKADHPILQAADMLAYSEWRKISDGDLTIYDAMHAPTMRFQPEFLDFDKELVDIVVNSAEKWMAQRKAWGQRKPPSNAIGV